MEKEKKNEILNRLKQIAEKRKNEIYQNNKIKNFEIIDFSKLKKNNTLEEKKINILTRSGNRPLFFKNLKTSLNLQKSKNFEHKVSNDNELCNYLKEEKNIVKVKKLKKNIDGLFPFNLYLNELKKDIKDNWVIIIDDDAKLVDENFINNLIEITKNLQKNEIIIYQCYIDKNKKILPNFNNFINNFKSGVVDMACFCIHSNLLKSYDFNGNYAGDFYILNQLNQQNIKFNLIKNFPIGIWANYEGAQHGSNKDINNEKSNEILDNLKKKNYGNIKPNINNEKSNEKLGIKKKIYGNIKPNINNEKLGIKKKFYGNIKPNINNEKSNEIKKKFYGNIKPNIRTQNIKRENFKTHF